MQYTVFTPDHSFKTSKPIESVASPLRDLLDAGRGRTLTIRKHRGGTYAHIKTASGKLISGCRIEPAVNGQVLRSEVLRNVDAS